MFPSGGTARRRPGAAAALGAAGECRRKCRGHRRWLAVLAAAGCLALPAGLRAKTSSTTQHTSHRATHAISRRTAHSRHRQRRSRGSVEISPARAREIQAALARAGYLHHASGHWDGATRAAMQKYQKDHHWQERFVPDARALIALGLGPKYDAPPVSAAKAAESHPGPGGRE